MNGDNNWIHSRCSRWRHVPQFISKLLPKISLYIHFSFFFSFRLLVLASAQIDMFNVLLLQRSFVISVFNDLQAKKNKGRDGKRERETKTEKKRKEIAKNNRRSDNFVYSLYERSELSNRLALVNISIVLIHNCHNEEKINMNYLSCRLQINRRQRVCVCECAIFSQDVSLQWLALYK